MKVWITKYALSKTGIYTAKAAPSETLPDMIVVTDSHGYKQYFHSKDWHNTEKEAKLRALKMVRAKLASLAKQREFLLELQETYK